MPKGVYNRTKPTKRVERRPKRMLIDILSEKPQKPARIELYRVRLASGFILRGK